MKERGRNGIDSDGFIYVCMYGQMDGKSMVSPLVSAKVDNAEYPFFHTKRLRIYLMVYSNVLMILRGFQTFVSLSIPSLLSYVNTRLKILIYVFDHI